MTEPTPEAPRSSPAAALPAPRVTKPRLFRLSLVWLVPLIAVVIGLSLLVRNYLQTGPRIQIEFNTAEGLEAGKTEVRYKEVAIGRVTQVLLRDDRKRVVATVQLDRSAADIAVADTKFWVVRPRIGTAGISGLGTLLSGAYIGVDAGTSDQEQRRFAGLESPPFILTGEPGSSFSLLASDLGSLDVGSPIYYRRTRVGRVVGFALDPVQDELTVKVFVDAPYHTLVTPNTRFWNASGVDLTLNANGLSLETQTLSSVLAGGVSFANLPDSPPTPPAADGSRFVLFSDRRVAMAPPDGEAVPARMVFDHSVRGLTVGAPVDFLGIEIGKVRSMKLQRDPRRRRFPVEVIIDLYPVRLGTALQESLGEASAPGAAGGDSSSSARRAVQRLVALGLKAQMRTGNLLTGQLYIALDFFRPGGSTSSPATTIAAARTEARGSGSDRSAVRERRRAERAARVEEAARLAAQEAAQNGIITLPTVAGTLSEIQPQVAQIVDKLSRIPFDSIGRDVHAAVARANDALARAGAAFTRADGTLERLTPPAIGAAAELQATLQRLQGSLDRLDRNLLDETSPVQRQTEQTLAEVQRAAQSLRVLADYLQRNPQTLLRGKPADEPLDAARRGTRSIEVRPLPVPPPADATVAPPPAPGPR